MPWLRLYTEILHDPKVARLSEVLRWRFVALLCCAGSQVTPTADDAAVGFVLRLKPKATAETKRQLQAAGLIDSEWFPVAWDRRQRVSDHDAAERQRRCRQRRLSHDGVTDASRDSHTLEQSRAETERRGDESTGRGERERRGAARPSAATDELAAPERMAARIGFRERRNGESLQQYAVQVAEAASHADPGAVF